MNAVQVNNMVNPRLEALYSIAWITYIEIYVHM